MRGWRRMALCAMAMTVLTTAGTAYATDPGAGEPTDVVSATGSAAEGTDAPTDPGAPTGSATPTPHDQPSTHSQPSKQDEADDEGGAAAPRDVAQSVVGVTKENNLDDGPVQPGDEYLYIITVRCSGLTAGCVNQTATDVLPAGLDVTSLPQATGGRTVDYDPATRTLTIRFTEALQEPADAVGLNDGATRVIEVGVRLPAGTTMADGDRISNTATTDADNADPASSTNLVEVDVPRVVAPVATKSWTDGSAIAGSGEDTVAVLGVRNASTGPVIVKELSVTDATAATYEHFDLTGVELSRFPAGADTAQLLVCREPVGTCTDADYTAVDTRTAPGAFAVPNPAGVTGFRVVFRDASGDALPFDSTGGEVRAGLELRSTLRSDGTQIDPTTRLTITNCAAPRAVDDQGAVTAGTSVCDTFAILPDTVLVNSQKTFFPDTNGDWDQDAGEYAVVGEDSPVTASVRIQNASAFPIRTITITEPDPLAPASQSEFDSLDVTTARLRLPSGATTAELVVQYADGTSATFDRTSNSVVDVTKAGTRVTSLSVTYTGVDGSGSPSIAENATAYLDVHGTLNSQVDAADLPNGSSPGVGNCAAFVARADTSNSTGTMSGSACATLAVETRRSSGTGVKTRSQSSLPEGQPIDFNLTLTNNGNVPLVDPEIVDPPVDGSGAPRAAGNPFDLVSLVSAVVTKDSGTPATALEVYDPRVSTWVAYSGSDTALLAAATGVRVRVLGELDPTKRVFLRVTVIRRDGVADGQTLTNCFQASGDGWTGFADDVCSAGVRTGPADSGAVINKAIQPAELAEPVPGVPTQTAQVRLTIANTGNTSASRLVLTDEDLDPAAPAGVRDFWDSVDLAQVSGVTFPLGADRVQLDALTAGGWVAGTPDGSAPWGLPTGVAPADVLGLRATFTANAGGYALRPCEGAPTPASCTGQVTFDVHPRQTRRSDGQPLGRVTLTDSASGGFETRLQTTGTLQPVAPVEATLSFVRGAPQLAVDKTPNSAIAPGETAPFRLKVVNSGTADLPDLVVEDELPAGLTFEESFAGDGGQPYRLVDTQVPAGTAPVPTPTFSTTTGNGGRISGLRWEFGSWTMRPGTTLVLEIQVTLAPGVTEGQVSTNLMGATSSHPDLACASGSGTQTGGSLGAGTWCTDTAAVTTKAGAAFQARKWVAGNDSLGWWDNRSQELVPVGDDACPVRSEGGRSYTAFPCVALVNPGDRYDYLLRFVNAGTEPATRMRVIDRFPVSGDKGVVLSGTDRGTQWDNRPRLATAPQLVGSGALSTSYAATEPLCTDDLAMGDDCAPGDWSAPFGPGVVAAQMRVQWDQPLAPGEGVSVTFSMDTPLEVARVADPTIAWNSFGHAETTRRANGGTRVLPPTEPIQVGVATAYGTLRVTKEVTSNPGDLPVSGLDFEFAYRCTIDPIGNPRQTAASGTLTLRDGESADVTGIPAGAACEVWETDARGGVSDHPQSDPATVTIAPQLGTQTAVSAVTIGNAFPMVPLSITKAVTGAAAQYGADTTYPVEVACTFGGVAAPGFPQTVQLVGNDTRTVDAPTGATCTAAELDAGGATSTTVRPADGVVIVPGAPTALELTVTNTFEAGRLQIRKEITGAGASLPTGPFDFEVSCAFEGTTLPPVTVTVDRPAGATEMVEDVPMVLPIGAVCTVTETDDGGADTTPAPVTVTIVENASDNTVQATFTNEFSAGTVALSKVLAGAGRDADYATDATFTVLVTCAKDRATDVLYSEPIQVKGGERVELTDADGDAVLLPLGTRCWTEETRTGGATSHTSDADSFDTGVEVTAGTPGDLQELELAVVNTFDLTSIALLKKVDGDAADYAAGREYVVALTCVLPQDGAMTPLLTAQAYTVVAGTPVVVPDLPVGAQCWAEETDAGGATATVVSHPGPTQPLTATPTGDDRISVTNTFDAAELTVTKKVVNGPAGPYAFEVSCTTAQGQVDLDKADAAFRLRAGQTRTISVPVGAECRVKEVDVPDAASVGYADSTAADGGRRDGRVVVDPDASVVVTNTFPRDDEGVVDGAVGGRDGEADGGDGGLLPNTGGPALWLLPVGALLLLAGGLVLRSRRRRPVSGA
ncbi:DUF5979 domain-containing protein [Nocardioides plantarum]|uniref:DUF5979 domain-containing protein n=1 Tax=Nocardioides plantarum TaxID=29299 RepID=A0ABV5K7G0_9ACTN|nr:DUF5979 domain-containing protein [Nocardioides plantarum]